MSQPRNCTLSVVFPTFRFDLHARQSLTMVAMAGSTDVQVLIGDNSVNPDKWAFLENLAAVCTNVHVFRHPENIGAHANYTFLLKQATSDMVCLVADDDCFSTDYFLAGAAILAREPDVAVASGLLIGLTPETDHAPADLFRAVPRTEDTALERIRQYGGHNVVAYGVTRRESLLNMCRYIDDTPLLASFMDYLATYSLLAEGKFRLDASRPVYLYVNNNWIDQDTSWKTSAAYYTACGLPEVFQHFHSIAWAIACLHLFLSTYRPALLRAEEAEQIAMLLYDRWLADFREKHDRNPTLYQDLLVGSPAAQEALREFVALRHAAPARRFSRFLVILTAFSPVLAERYRVFLTASLVGPDHWPGTAEDRAPDADAAVPCHADRETVLEVERLRTRVRGLEDSTSWRITAPLRLVASMLPPRRR